MNSETRAAIVWTLGGVAFVVSGLMMEPKRPLTFIAAALFFAVGIRAFQRGKKAT